MGASSHLIAGDRTWLLHFLPLDTSRLRATRSPRKSEEGFLWGNGKCIPFDGLISKLRRCRVSVTPASVRTVSCAFCHMPCSLSAPAFILRVLPQNISQGGACDTFALLYCAFFSSGHSDHLFWYSAGMLLVPLAFMLDINALHAVLHGGRGCWGTILFGL